MNRVGKALFFLKHQGYYRLYRKYRDYTMTPAMQFIQNMLLAEGYRDKPGVIVECGVWKGGMVAGLAEVMGTGREYYLFDSFEGLPPAREIDGEAAQKWQADVTSPWYHNNCSAEEEYATRAMELSGSVSFHIRKGWFSKTLPQFEKEKHIALLRLDGDWYESTMECLEHLFPLVTEGGLIIIDDYTTWEGCAKAVQEYLAKNKRTERVQLFQDTIPYLVKKSM